MGQSELLKLLVFLLYQLKLSLVSIESNFVQNSLNFGLDLLEFLLELQRNLSLLKGYVLLTIDLSYSLIDQIDLRLKKDQNLFDPFLLAFELLNSHVIMKERFVLKVVRFATLAEIKFRVRKKPIGTNAADEKLADFWVV